MVKPICERKTLCIFLEKIIEDMFYKKSAFSDYLSHSKILVYYCTNPKKIGCSDLTKIILSSEEKYKQCGYKVTKQLGDFINVK